MNSKKNNYYILIVFVLSLLFVPAQIIAKDSSSNSQTSAGTTLIAQAVNETRLNRDNNLEGKLKGAIKAKPVPGVQELIAMPFDGKQLKRRNSFAINLQDTNGSFVFTYVILVDTQDRLMKVFLVRPGKAPVKWSESKITINDNMYTVITRSGKKFRINTNKKYFFVNDKKTKLIRLSTKNVLPAVDIQKECNKLAQRVDSASPTNILPPYNGCCADCCWVHEATGLPDWADAWCCMGYCGGSGSCTE